MKEEVYEPMCYESHPALPLGECKVYGGNASHPIVKDADIYVTLQAGSSCNCLTDPWDEEENPVIEARYFIQDRDCPKNPVRFKRMITWLCNQLQKGKKVHVGCIGGHGRTGMVLAALVAELTEEKNAIQYVRKHYCKKAVETEVQIEFLMKHFGVSKVEPSKPKVVFVESEVVGSKKPVRQMGNHYNSTLTYGSASSGLPTRTLTEEVILLPKYAHITKPNSAPMVGAQIFQPVKSSRGLWKLNN